MGSEQYKSLPQRIEQIPSITNAAQLEEICKTLKADIKKVQHSKIKQQYSDRLDQLYNIQLKKYQSN